jgi:DNA-binding MarR family transcriptional regulator
MNEKSAAPHSRSVTGLHLTPSGLVELVRKAEKTALELANEATERLSSAERKTLIRLLKKVEL